MSLLNLNADCLGVVLDHLAIRELTRLALVNRKLSWIVRARSGYQLALKEFSRETQPYKRFLHLCRMGYLVLAQNYFRDHPSIDWHAYRDGIFASTCYNGHLDVVQTTASCDSCFPLESIGFGH